MKSEEIFGHLSRLRAKRERMSFRIFSHFNSVVPTNPVMRCSTKQSKTKIDVIFYSPVRQKLNQPAS